MKNNPLFEIDFYKADHRRQYPAKTELVYSNFTPRFNKHANVPNKNGIIFFGLQYFLKHFMQDMFDENFFCKPKDEVVADYKRIMDLSLGEGAVPVEHIAALHDLQYLPVQIRALPEGTFVPVGVPVLTIENTLPEFFWLTNYLESVLSAYLWLPCTSATTAWNLRKLFDNYADLTGSPDWFTEWQGHDFSFRGMSSVQSAVMSGAGHLLSFKGTDTVSAIPFLEHYYLAEGQVGGSVPATEHSVMCMGGMDDEIGTFRRLITELYPKGIVSIVSDTWDFWKVMTEFTVALKDEILAREGKVVFRPDSGNPLHIIAGDPDAPEGSVERKGAVEVLWEIFGGTVTDKGYKLLDPHVGLIYGDSIDYKMAQSILEALAQKGFASANIVFGVGSFTYQYVTRDTWGWAVKATYGIVDGTPRSIFKKPKTDSGKNSAKGLVRVIDNGYGFLMLQDSVTERDVEHEANKLKLVFKDSRILIEANLKEIRERVAS